MKEAGVVLPRWAVGAFLNVFFLFLYCVAVMQHELKPPAMISTATNVAIVLSLLLGICLTLYEVLRSEDGKAEVAFYESLNTSLNVTWSCIAVAFLVYIAYEPVSQVLKNNLAMVVILMVACALVVVGFLFARPSSLDVSETNAQHNQLAVVNSIQPTEHQRPVFQATITDLTRLLAHQAGRTIGYAGSNILFDDNFSLELDINERVARVYSNTNLINTSDFMYWRLHMLLMGPASEKALLGQSSEVAVDDFTNFDDLASRYLTLQEDRTFNAKPINQYEAALKASRISLLRKTIFDRCYAECNANKKVLIDLVKLMRTRSVLNHGDIRPLLDRVEMQDSFPVARFEDKDIFQKALLAYDAPEEVTIEDYLDHGKGAPLPPETNSDATAHDGPDATQNEAATMTA